MVQADLARLQQLLYEYNTVRNEIVALRARMAELRNAKRILEEKKPKTVFRSIGPLMIETGLEDAKRYIEDELEITELRLKKLEEQEKRLLEAIRELERKLGIAQQ
jgi:chaperonin cofactor prefoldin